MVLRSSIAMAKGHGGDTNGRARKWLSRDVAPLTLSEQELIQISNMLNATPRKCLGCRTPAEGFRKKPLTQIRSES